MANRTCPTCYRSFSHSIAAIRSTLYFPPNRHQLAKMLTLASEGESASLPTEIEGAPEFPPADSLFANRISWPVQKP
jgi:hypothetical protein